MCTVIVVYKCFEILKWQCVSHLPRKGGAKILLSASTVSEVEAGLKSKQRLVFDPIKP